jgi:hypothetical protein
MVAAPLVVVPVPVVVPPVLVVATVGATPAAVGVGSSGALRAPLLVFRPTEGFASRGHVRGWRRRLLAGFAGTFNDGTRDRRRPPDASVVDIALGIDIGGRELCRSQ